MVCSTACSPLVADIAWDPHRILLVRRYLHALLLSPVGLCPGSPIFPLASIQIRVDNCPTLELHHYRLSRTHDGFHLCSLIRKNYISRGRTLVGSKAENFNVRKNMSLVNKRLNFQIKHRRAENINTPVTAVSYFNIFPLARGKVP